MHSKNTQSIIYTYPLYDLKPQWRTSSKHTFLFLYMLRAVIDIIHLDTELTTH